MKDFTSQPIKPIATRSNGLQERKVQNPQEFDDEIDDEISEITQGIDSLSTANNTPINLTQSSSRSGASSMPKGRFGLTDEPIEKIVKKRKDLDDDLSPDQADARGMKEPLTEQRPAKKPLINAASTPLFTPFKTNQK